MFVTALCLRVYGASGAALPAFSSLSVPSGHHSGPGSDVNGQDAPASSSHMCVFRYVCTPMCACACAHSVCLCSGASAIRPSGPGISVLVPCDLLKPYSCLLFIRQGSSETCDSSTEGSLQVRSGKRIRSQRAATQHRCRQKGAQSSGLLGARAML